MKYNRHAPTLQNTTRYYKDVCFVCLALLVMAWFYYGWRPVVMGFGAMILGNLCDRLISVLRKRPYVPEDYSNECFGLLIALMLPATCSWYVLVVAVLAGVLMGKEAFGGYGSYPFHPAAVGYCVAAVSWPTQVFRYPEPGTVVPLWDTSSVSIAHSISSILKNGGMPSVDTFDMLLGNYAGPIGTTAVIVIVACALFLLVRRDISLYAPAAFLITCALIAFFFPRQAILQDTAIAETVSARIAVVRYELLSDAMLFGAVFLINEPYTTPYRHRGGRIVYGILAGLAAMAFRYFGVYQAGICFALLGVNSISAWIDLFAESVFRSFFAKREALKGGAADAKV